MHLWVALVLPALLILATPAAQAEKVPMHPWYHEALDIETAWKYTKGNAKGLIALIDSGIDYKQDFLKPNIWHNPYEKTGNNRDNDRNGYKNDVIGWNFDLENNNPMDESAHGTWLASFMVARPGKDHPTGICPGCQIMPLRIFDEEGMGDDDALVDAIYYAIDNGARVINLATASEGTNPELRKALVEAGKHDVLVLAAASNDHEDLDRADTYPARYQFPFMVTVAATRQNGNLTSNSNWGKKTVHFGAPGIDLVAYWRVAEDGDPPGWFVDGEGTSDAVAMASAVAGLIRSHNPTLKATDVKDILMNTVTPSKYLTNKTITGGIINAGAALKCAHDLKCLR